MLCLNKSSTQRPSKYCYNEQCGLKKNGFVHNASSHMRELSSHISFINDMIDGGLPILSVMGTMHEIGYWEGVVTSETPCSPLSQYGIAKNALRQSLLLYAKSTETKLRWLRAFYIYGDDDNSSSIFGRIIRAVKNGERSIPLNSGTNLYDFIHISKLVKQIVQATVQTDYQGIINVCSGRPITLSEQLEMYIRENDFDILLDYGAFPDRPYDSPGIWGDATVINAIMS